MPELTLFARARPERVSLTETYAYHQKLTSNPDLRVSNAPDGLIDVWLPLDGRQSFGREAVADIQTQRDRGRGLRHVRHAIVGRLAVASHGATDLGHRLGLTAEFGSWPVSVAVPWSAMDDPVAALDDRRECRVREEYRPDAPQVPPVALQFELYDANRLAEQGTEWGELPGLLALGFCLHVTLPGPWPANRAPIVKRLMLRWPCSPSLERMALVVDKDKATEQSPGAGSPRTGYDAISGMVCWYDVPGEWKEDRGGLQRWSSRGMILVLAHLGDLAGQAQLQGEAEVEVQGLLSGAQAAWYDATGHRQTQASNHRDVLPEAATLLRLSFEINLDDALHMGERLARQRLHFDGIMPDEANRKVIVRALGDLGFTVPEEKGIGRPGITEIRAERAEAGKPLRLYISVGGKSYKVTRVINGSGGVTDTTEIDGGEMDLDAKGLSCESAQSLIQVMNELHRLLHERFPRQQVHR